MAPEWRRAPARHDGVFVIFGFESGDNPGAAPDQASRFLLTIFPAGLMVVSLAFSFFISFRESEAPVPRTAA